MDLLDGLGLQAADKAPQQAVEGDFLSTLLSAKEAKPSEAGSLVALPTLVPCPRCCT